MKRKRFEENNVEPLENPKKRKLGIDDFNIKIKKIDITSKKSTRRTTGNVKQQKFIFSSHTKLLKNAIRSNINLLNGVHYFTDEGNFYVEVNVFLKYFFSSSNIKEYERGVFSDWLFSDDTNKIEEQKNTPEDIPEKISKPTNNFSIQPEIIPRKIDMSNFPESEVLSYGVEGLKKTIPSGESQKKRPETVEKGVQSGERARMDYLFKEKDKYNTIKKVYDEILPILKRFKIEPLRFFHDFLNHNKVGQEFLKSIIPQPFKVSIDQAILVMDEKKFSFDDFYYFYNMLGLNEYVPSVNEISVRHNELHKKIDKLLYKTENGVFSSLRELLTTIVELHFYLNLCSSNNVLVKLALDEGANVAEHLGKIAVTITISNSIIFGLQDKTFLVGVCGGGESFENYKKNLEQMRIDIEDVVKNGIELDFSKRNFVDPTTSKKVKFRVGFILCTDLKTLWALCEKINQFQEFCAYCFKDFKERFFFRDSGVREKIESLLGIPAFIMCIMHMFERITEYECKLVSFWKMELALLFLPVIRKGQSNFCFSFEPDKKKRDGTRVLKTSMIYGKNCFKILELLIKNMESVYEEYNKSIRKINSDLPKGTKKLHLISKSQIKDIKKCVSDTLHALVKLDSPIEDVSKDGITKLYSNVKKLFKIQHKVDKNHQPIYFHYLKEAVGLMGPMGEMSLKPFKNEAVERVNKDRVKVIDKKINFSQSVSPMRQEMNHSFREIIIMQDRLEKLKNHPKLNVERLVKCLRIDSRPIENLLKFNWRKELIYSDSKIKCFREILNELRHRNVQEKSKMKVSVWRDNPYKFFRYEYKTGLNRVVNVVNQNSLEEMICILNEKRG